VRIIYETFVFPGTNAPAYLTLKCVYLNKLYIIGTDRLFVSFFRSLMSLPLSFNDATTFSMAAHGMTTLSITTLSIWAYLQHLA
jgi:hypothetical protein